MVRFNAKKLILVSIMLFGLWAYLNVMSAWAACYDCNDPRAKWNRATNGGFECRVVTAAERPLMAVIDSKSPCPANSQSSVCGAILDFANPCPAGQICARPIDCEEAVGGVCLFSSGGAPRLSDIDCSTYSESGGTGVTRNEFTVTLPGTRETMGPFRWEVNRFRCPDSNKTTCWRPVTNATPEEETQVFQPEANVNLPTITVTKPLPETESAPVLQVSDCCRRIVPVINYKTEDYSLNHLVQTAINVYECILCIVGSLILLMLIFGAVMMMISAGNEALVAKGKQIIGAAVIGALIVFFSFFIVNFTVKALGGKFSNESRMDIRPSS